jgi:hypothetical protein
MSLRLCRLKVEDAESHVWCSSFFSILASWQTLLIFEISSAALHACWTMSLQNVKYKLQLTYVERYVKSHDFSASLSLSSPSLSPSTPYISHNHLSTRLCLWGSLYSKQKHRGSMSCSFCSLQFNYATLHITKKSNRSSHVCLVLSP